MRTSKRYMIMLIKIIRESLLLVHFNKYILWTGFSDLFLAAVAAESYNLCGILIRWELYSRILTIPPVFLVPPLMHPAQPCSPVRQPSSGL